MNPLEQFTLTELKAHAYDQLAKLQQQERYIQQINLMIEQKTTAELKELPKDSVT